MSKMLSARVDEGIVQRVKVRCAELDLTVAEVVEGSLRRWLDDPPVLGPATHPQWQSQPVQSQRQAPMDGLVEAIRRVKRTSAGVPPVRAVEHADEPVGVVRTPNPRPAGSTPAIGATPVWESEPVLADEVRCKVCGERLRDHRSGASGQVAIRTNCRRFVAP